MEDMRLGVSQVAPVRLLTATVHDRRECSNHPGGARRVFPGAGSVLMDSEGRSAHHPCKHTLYAALRQRAEQLRIPPNKHVLHASAVPQEPADRDTMAVKKPPLVFGVKAES